MKLLNFKTNIITKYFSENFNGQVRKFNNINITPIEFEVEQLLIPSNDKNVILMERPVAIRGVVLPLETKGRKTAPNPIAFDSLIKYIKSVNAQNKFSILSPFSDRGHIFALELGGPNCKYNIMPQWKGFQEHGDWRKLERNLKTNASALLKNNNTLFLEVNIEYMNLNMQDLSEKLSNIFNFTKLSDFTERRAKKCMQIFGVPMGYNFHSFPCNINIRKPRNHFLSISYIKYLYELACMINQNKSSKTFATKSKAAQSKLNKGWGIRKFEEKDLINLDNNLLNNIHKYCDEGKFVISAITEAAL